MERKIDALGDSGRQLYLAVLFCFPFHLLKAELLMLLDRVTRSNIFGSVINKGFLTAIYETAYALIARIRETN